jgi:hypothetical protein
VQHFGVPRVVTAFWWFCVAAVAIDLVLFLPPLRSLQAAMMPLTGWAASMPYLFALGSWPKRDASSGADYFVGLKRYLLFSSGVLFLFAVFGAASFAYFRELADDGNPWLRVSPWRPVWTVIVPMLWAVALARGVVGLGLAGGGLSAAKPVAEDNADWQPTLRQAIGLVAFAIAFAGLKWVEHRWMIAHGDYAGIGMHHSAYWTARPWISLTITAAICAWWVVRNRRR